MTKSRAKLAVLLVATFVLGAVAVVAQGKYRKASHAGPYRAFLSRPVLSLGWQAGSLYREHELVGAVLNDIHKKGFQPVSTELMSVTGEGQPSFHRLLVICREP